MARRRRARSAAGDAATDVVLATFRANGAFLTAGDRLAAEEGLTAARWQVLGALALAGRPLTVPQVARRMGLARQSVQATVNRLLAERLVESEDNPDHQRSPLIRPSSRGAERYAALERRQARWADALAAGTDPADLATAARVLRELAERLTEGSSDAAT
jgi:DNA-binding MarR family transcriptional regulator